MANKQTAGLQLIDLKGIDLSNGPVKIKGVYQQVIANKFIKTITNLVYDGYAYDDFPITLTTTDGLTYTGKYIDTVSSEMLQWLSITINNQSEVTVSKELFEGGGGGGSDVGYEEITEGTALEKARQADLIVFKASKVYKGYSRFITIYNDSTNETLKIQQTSSDPMFANIGDTYLLNDNSRQGYLFSFRCSNSPNQLIYIDSNGARFGIVYATGTYSSSSPYRKGIIGGTATSAPSILDSDLKFYRNKSISKLLQSI